MIFYILYSPRNTCHLGVNHAYVTTIGRLIGVVGLKELRKAIEDVNHRHGFGQDQSAGQKEDSSEALSQVRTDKMYEQQNTVTSTESVVTSSILSTETED